jgi:glycosyltransferase involved in cell wall biosynthesis
MKLRIGIEAHVLGRRQTGNERVIAALCERLGRISDHKIFIYVTSSEAADDWGSRALPRTTVKQISAAPLPRLLRGLPAQASEDQLDVLLAHVNTPPRCSCPTVMLIHDVGFRRQWRLVPVHRRLYMNLTIPASLRWSNHIVTVSDFSKQEIEALYAVPPGKITVAPNGVDSDWWADGTPAAPARPYLFAACNLTPHKNLRTLIGGYRLARRRFPELPESLVIAGNPGYRSQAQEADAADLIAAGHLTFAGYLSDTALRKRYQGATAFAFPSLYEGFGLPPLEAMAAGTSVLAADIPVMREVCGDAAGLVPPLSQLAWADGLIKASRDRPWRAATRERGRERARLFSWDRSAQVMLEVLQATATSSLHRSSRRRYS